MSTKEIVARCEQLFEDLDFNAVKQWKAAAPGRKAIGYLPIYVPREIVHAAGMLPVGIFGGGDQLEVIQGDAYYQSYICRIPRSTLELGLTGRLDCLDGMLFPSICDVIRNLSGMWQILFKDKYVKYFDLPQNYDDATGGRFYMHEMDTLRKDLSALGGKDITEENLKASIAVYNDNRKAVRELYACRAQKPWQAPTSEVYLVLRAGCVLPPEEHTALIRSYLIECEKQKRPQRDNARVILTGAFCEQPPLGLIKSIEMAGCYVVEDDLLLGWRWFTTDVATDGDPFERLGAAYVNQAVPSSTRHESRQHRAEGLIEKVRRARADAVVFMPAKFCEPALFDYVLMKQGLEREGIPHLLVEFEEKMWTFERTRNEIETFVESMLFE